MSPSAGCFFFLVFRKKLINVIVKNKSTTIFHGLLLIAHRNDAINCSKLCSETTRLRLLVPLEF